MSEHDWTNPATTLVDGSMARIRWLDSQGRRCTNFLSAQQIGDDIQELTRLRAEVAELRAKLAAAESELAAIKAQQGEPHCWFVSGPDGEEKLIFEADQVEPWIAESCARTGNASYEYTATELFASPPPSASPQVRSGGEWRPIESAPKDGTPILVTTDHRYGSRVHRVFWDTETHGPDIGTWSVQDCKFGRYPLRGYSNLLGWQPLPEPLPLPTPPHGESTGGAT